MSPTNGTAPRRDWARLVLGATARATLIVVGTMLLWSALPAVWGWVPTTVASDSMAPRIRAGDVVIAAPTIEPRIGRVLLVEDPDRPERLRLHRLVEIDPDGSLVLRGDANAAVDSTPVESDAVRGVAMLRVPWVGLPGLWMSRGDVLPLALAVSGLMVLLLLSALGSPARGRRRGPPGERRRRANASTSRAVVTMVLSAAIVGVPGVASGATAGVTPSAARFQVSTTAQSGFAAAPRFPCFSGIPADSPYLAYTFSEPDGATAIDSTANGRAGTLQPGATRTAGRCGVGANPFITLDGTTGSVTTPGPIVSPTSFSIELWFRTTTTRGGRLLGFGSSATGISTTTDRQLFMADDGTIVAGAGSALQKLTATSPLRYNDGQWHHAVMTRTGLLGLTVSISLAIDGQTVASTTGLLSSGSYSGYWRVGTDSLTGWTPASTSPAFAGAVDSVAVYSAPLTGAQIAAHYAAGR